jgi:DNA-directed RNA polymerase subunit RPC12/RpoP
MIKYLIAGLLGIGILKIYERNKRIVCQKCGWSWKVKDGGNDLYVCHKCGTDNTKFYTK